MISKKLQADIWSTLIKQTQLALINFDYFTLKRVKNQG